MTRTLGRPLRVATARWSLFTVSPFFRTAVYEIVRRSRQHKCSSSLLCESLAFGIWCFALLREWASDNACLLNTDIWYLKSFTLSLLKRLISCCFRMVLRLVSCSRMDWPEREVARYVGQDFRWSCLLCPHSWHIEHTLEFEWEK